MEHGRPRQAGEHDAATAPRSSCLGAWFPPATRAAGIALPLLALGLGCGSLTPRSFRALTHPAPLVRARSLGYGAGLPEPEVVPALIERLGDADPVVRMTAHEELRRRTGQNFGYVPWAPPADRAKAVEQWRAWWKRRQGGQVRSRTTR